ncbi:hypothetical protein DRO02_04355 [archaeon]|nr:MAG: hypothetical protein DRO02_04355 [archaeon]
MRAGDIAWLSLEHIKKRKVRSTLVMLGIALGVLAMSSIMYISLGFEENIKMNMEGMFNVKTIWVVSLFSEQPLKDVRVIDDIKSIPHVEVASPALLVPVSVRYGGESADEVLLIAVEHSKIRHVWGNLYKPKIGSIPSDTDKLSVVVGSALAERLGIRSIGESVKIIFTVEYDGKEIPVEKNLYVAAILDTTGVNLAGVDIDYSLFMSLVGFYDMIKSSEAMPQELKDTYINKFNIVTVHVSDAKYVDDVGEAIKWLLGDVRVVALKYYARAVYGVLGIFKGLLMALAIIALLVAGISVLNTMQTSVRERIHEIGIMKAIGTGSSTILGLFLAEALWMGIVGSILGLVMGILVSLILAPFLGSVIQFGVLLYVQVQPKFPMEWVIGPIVFGVLTSLGFSAVPSYRASKLDPVVALRTL